MVFVLEKSSEQGDASSIFFAIMTFFLEREERKIIIFIINKLCEKV